MKRKWCSMEKKTLEEFSKDESSILKLLWIMQGEKDPQKWHENIFGNKRCKHSQNFVEESSESSKSKDGRDVSLKNLYQETQFSTEISSPEVCFSSQEYLIHDSYSPSSLPLMKNFREYILEHGEPLHKQLTMSDVNVNQNRLLLNKNHVEKSFLPLLKNDENIERGIQVCVYDAHQNTYSLIFKKWTNKYYVLNGGWKDFFQVHKLQKNDTITIWIFRHSSFNKLCFAIDYKKIERRRDTKPIMIGLHHL
ncbi:hypothetical protein VNO80_26482 [Phaseolus coccineus]|uniref:TF-B3 domain-containing protein n=1 Tax=Phaseolus coccineus TaxID=3886 RepID=A0AAN9LFQ0_PHACN